MCVSCLILRLNRNESIWDSDYGAERGEKSEQELCEGESLALIFYWILLVGVCVSIYFYLSF